MFGRKRGVMVDILNSFLEYDVLLPDPTLDQMLEPCPICGAKYCIPEGKRLGPAVIMYNAKQYRVVCVKCWYKGKMVKSDIEAVKAWNNQRKPSRLREIRLEAGLSQLALAEMAGVGKTAISHYERARSVPRDDVRERIAKALNVPVEAI
jgi:DNA-binding XRE family transcriptional regulator